MLGAASSMEMGGQGLLVLPPNDQAYITRKWYTLLGAIELKFLDTAWIRKSEQEFKEMKFRRHQHDKESPPHCRPLLYPEVQDRPGYLGLARLNQQSGMLVLTTRDACQ